MGKRVTRTFGLLPSDRQREHASADTAEGELSADGAPRALRGPESGQGEVVVWQWRRHRRCVGLARAQLRKALAAWGLGELEFAAVAVLSELVANAVVHARVSPGREIRTRFLVVEDGVRIEVHDASDQLPVPRVPDESGGYGLALVAELAERWGVEERSGVGKCVWATVTCSGLNAR